MAGKLWWPKVGQWL